ncbi:MAG: hypothetical protein IPG67_05580 [Acidobacteria bacterium]|nr:hypothetical protein [Acidobacteriota bacterium]
MRKSVSTFLFLLLLTTAAFALPDISPSAFEKQATELRTKLKGRSFTVIVERPFIVVGDESADSVTLWANDIIRGTVTRLKQDYFAKDPAKILEIWLFKDEISYRKHAKEFFNDEPDTPYGYYLPSSKVLVMNIATGGGTLVHEIVHPFVEANFPDAPAWLNEGLGSLYEQSGTVDGHIYGYTNWRLNGLQNGLRKKIVPTFKTLTSMSDAEFYREDTGTNYAQARYLCYYLQEKGLLRKFYKDFVANQKTDPTGYKTLQRTLGERDKTAFQKRWEAFIMKLVF